MNMEQEFFERIARIPRYGLGLSVDMYTPDLFELLAALKSAGLSYGYLEIFKAPLSVLVQIRRRLPELSFEYHAEGLWVSQPSLEAAYPFEAELAAAVQHLAALGSRWINHECASKQMAGFSFGTYVPPLFTGPSADIIAANARLIQRRLAASGRFAVHQDPLLLLEVPPLPYFGFGDLSVPDFFQRVIAQAPCGLVLDIGHVWTIYRYSGAWRRLGLMDFLEEFLDRFPLHRVVQIHVAGLAVEGAAREARVASAAETAAPLWIDTHSAPIPAVLFDMLEQVLAHPELSNLRGLALEVDTKAIPLIASEFRRFHDRFGDWERTGCYSLSPWVRRTPLAERLVELRCSDAARLHESYRCYARVVTGRGSFPIPDGVPPLGQDTGPLDLYHRQFLPREILEWGGNVRDMFPASCRLLENAGVALSSFVDFWFREPRSTEHPYDFFLLKLDRFLDFIQERVPHELLVAQQEADALRKAYRAACEEVQSFGDHGVKNGSNNE